MSEQRYCDQCGFLPPEQIRKTAIGNHYCAECEGDAIIAPPFVLAMQERIKALEGALLTEQQDNLKLRAVAEAAYRVTQISIVARYRLHNDMRIALRVAGYPVGGEG